MNLRGLLPKLLLSNLHQPNVRVCRQVGFHPSIMRSKIHPGRKSRMDTARLLRVTIATMRMTTMKKMKTSSEWIGGKWWWWWKSASMSRKPHHHSHCCNTCSRSRSQLMFHFCCCQPPSWPLPFLVPSQRCRDPSSSSSSSSSDRIGREYLLYLRAVVVLPVPCPKSCSYFRNIQRS